MKAAKGRPAEDSARNSGRSRKTSDQQPPAARIELAHCSLILDGHVVLDDVSFAVRPGERWALVGPNGSGKTLLLKMLRGDVWPTPVASGGANGGADTQECTNVRRYCFDGECGVEPAGFKQHIAYVGPERQDKYVRYGWNLRVMEVVTTGLFDEDIPLTKPTRAQRERVARVLRRFGLWGLRTRRMLTLSYGQRRLALVARAFASDATVLLLDEVFNGLDVHAKEKLRGALEQPRGGRDWVITSHRPHELPANVTHVAQIEAGRVVSVRSGRLAAAGNGKAGRARPAGAVNLRVARETRRTRDEGAWLVRIHGAHLFRDYRPVIRDVHWTVKRGEHWAVLGANGSGKSTLLSVIYGDLHPALGGAIDRAGHRAGAHIEGWKQRVGWVSPELQADHYLAKSIEEIVISGRYASVGLNEPPTGQDRASALRWLKFFRIEHLRDRGPRQASYGQMRLALIARAMVNDPELLLLDEPCSGLDSDVRTNVLALIDQLARRGTQIIMAVHDAHDIVPAVRNVLRIGRGGSIGIARRS